MYQRTFAAAAAMIAALLMGCDSEPQRPVEQIGEPLAVAPEPLLEAAPADAAPAEADSERPPGPGDRHPAARSPDAGPQAPQPARALALASEADELGARGQLAQAEATYARAIQLNPRSPWLLTAHAWYLSRLGRQAPSRDELERALDLDERRRDPLLVAAIHLGIGEIREASSDRTRARESYRTALRAWAGPPLARALLRLTPTTDLQYPAAAKIAFGPRPVPEPVSRLLGLGGRIEPLAFAEAPGLGLAIVTAQPPPAQTKALAAGAQYALRLVGPTADAPDAGPPRPTATQLALVEVPAVRWHTARLEVVPLGPDRSGLLITLERSAPGAGAPLEVGTTLVGREPSGELRVLFTRVTGSERDDPLGCRRGWREAVALHDEDGDGAPDSVRLTREDFVRPRLETAEPYCSPRQRTRPAQLLPMTPRAQEATANEGADGGGEAGDLR